MKCTRCDSETEKGVMTGDGRHWFGLKSKRGKMVASKFVTPGFGATEVWAYKCTNCGAIDLSTK